MGEPDSLHAKRRALIMWVIFVPSPFFIAAIARIVGAPISDGAVITACLLFSLIFFASGFSRLGSSDQTCHVEPRRLRSRVCLSHPRFFAHRAALERVKKFVALERIHPEAIGALPYPPSILNWDGLVRTSRGVYEMKMDLSKKASFQ